MTTTPTDTETTGTNRKNGWSRSILLPWLGRSAVLMLVVSALTFLLISLTPGDPVRTSLGTQFATEEQYQALVQQMGLDQPLFSRYWSWLTSAVQGDLGESLFSGRSVWSIIGARFGVSLSLMLGSLLVAGIVGVTLGTLGAIRRGATGRVVDVLALGGSSVPTYWLGLVLATIFGVRLGWFPVVGYTSLGESVSGWLRSLAIPVVTLGITGAGIIAKQTRDAVADELGRDYVVMLRAQGTPEAVVIALHVLRNAAVPIVTVLGLLLIGLVSGTVLLETVFSLPGLGGLVVTSSLNHDLPVVQGVVVVFALIVVTVNLAVDISYSWLNPKIRRDRGSR